MAAKHFLHDPTQAVLDSLKSLTLTSPSLRFDPVNKAVYRSSFSSKLALVSGGGAGHEPAWGGYIGHGGLSASVCGTIFASPSAEQIRKCISLHIPEDKDVLVVVMNYTGDVLNFGLACEKARLTGRNVAMVVVGDDVGVPRSQAGKVGRRGLSGVAFVMKVCGALAELGASMDETVKFAEEVKENLGSISVSLGGVHVIGRAEDRDAELSNDEVELGMGIHNESGCGHINNDLPLIVKTMLNQILSTEDEDRNFLPCEKGEEIVLIVNNLGGLSNLELGAILTEVHRQLEITWRLTPVRVYMGTMNGSLDGKGFTISLLRSGKVKSVFGKHTILDLLDEPSELAGWPGEIRQWPSKGQTHSQTTDKENDSEADKHAVTSRDGPLKIDDKEGSSFKNILVPGLDAVVAAEPQITRYDTIVGDGDCGTGLKRGAQAIKAFLQNESSDDLILVMSRIVETVERSMDGTSGAIYAIFLNAILYELQQINDSTMSTKAWGNVLKGASESLGKYTPASAGDRTLIDALAPFVETLQRTSDFKQAAIAAKQGAENTKGMKPALGRSVYIGNKDWETVPDPGAYGLAVLLTGMAKAYSGGDDGDLEMEK